MDLDDIAHELYTADPAEFIAARDRAAREADAELGARIKKLRKPTLAAWAVNVLASQRSADLEELLGLGERLRTAQRELRGDDVRELAAERTRLLRALTARAVELAAESGYDLAETARDQIERTLTAAVSDPESAEAVRAASLAKPLEYSGFGLDELAAASIRRKSAEPKPAPSRAERGKMRKRLREREKGLAEAEQQLRAAEEEHRAAEEEQQRLREELTRAQERLRSTRDDLHEAERAHQRALRAREAAARELGEQ